MQQTIVGDSAFWEYLVPEKKYIVLEGRMIVRIISGVSEYKTSSKGLLIEVGREYTPEEYYWRMLCDSLVNLDLGERSIVSIANNFQGVIEDKGVIHFKNTGRKDIYYFPCDKDGGLIGTIQSRGLWGLNEQENSRRVKSIRTIKNDNENFVRLIVEFSDD
ncbi:MAG: hypothetical protein ABIK73_07040 [candidate division WOR-3 bacterium]